MNIGERIKKRREELGLTQEELALRVGYTSKSTINKIELGINELRQRKIISFCEALNITPEYLIFGEQTSDPLESLFTKIKQLDHEDTIKLEERVDVMLESDKYKKTDSELAI